MKHTLKLIAALAVLMAMPAAAQTVGGCEMKPIANSNALQRVDPNCAFNFDSSTPGGERSLVVDGEIVLPELPGADA